MGARAQNKEKTAKQSRGCFAPSFSRLVEKRHERRPDKAKMPSLWVINEYFEPNFYAVWPSAIVFQAPVTAIST
jgi:hypothetical protein